MIADSDKHTFEAVFVYQLDRFARNRYDSAMNKAKLKKNGVHEIFELYAEGKTITEINAYLNAKQVKASQDNLLNKNSLHRLLRNKRYVGILIYKSKATPNGMPRIIEDKLIERVQQMIDRNKKAPAWKRGRRCYNKTILRLLPRDDGGLRRYE